MNDEFADQVEMPKWEEREHPIWTEVKDSITAHGLNAEVYPKLQWIRGNASIVAPCGITNGSYELYIEGKDIARFESLEDAKLFADDFASRI